MFRLHVEHPLKIFRLKSIRRTWIELTAFTATRGIVGPYEIDFRILLDDLVRWVSARGRGDDENIRAGVMFGIFLDVTQRKLAEESHELIAGEMSHRVKNLLAVASALTQITSRAATTQEMAKDLTNRLITLGRVQDLVRPAPGQERRAVLMQICSRFCSRPMTAAATADASASHHLKSRRRGGFNFPGARYP